MSTEIKPKYITYSKEELSILETGLELFLKNFSLEDVGGLLVQSTGIKNLRKISISPSEKSGGIKKVRSKIEPPKGKLESSDSQSVCLRIDNTSYVVKYEFEGR